MGLFETAMSGLRAEAVENYGIVTPRMIGDFCFYLREHELDSFPVLASQNGCLWKNVEVFVGEKRMKIVDAPTIFITKSRSNDGKVVPSFAIKIRTGVQKVYRVKFKSGKEVLATGQHRFMTKTGWKRTKELKEFDGVVSL